MLPPGETACDTGVADSEKSGTVNLSVSDLPKFANAKFNPVSVVDSGTSVLTVNTNRNVAIGTSTLIVTGTGGSGVHSANVGLIVQ